MFNKKRVLIILISIIVPLLCGYFYLTFSFVNGDKIAYAYSTPDNTLIELLENNTKSYKFSKEDARTKIENLFDNPFYFYNETKLENKNGLYSPILRTITISESLSIDEYVLTLTHELVHMTNNTADERFTTFETFKILYESKDFNGVACKLGAEILNGNVSYHENCSYQIQKYLSI